ncbi:MAG TPA: cellulase family glycosylhydrolase [Verrucomicrobiae bacterium]
MELNNSSAYGLMGVLLMRSSILCLAVLAAAFVWPLSAATAATNHAKLPRIRLTADGRAFETEHGTPFVPFGMTYFRPGTGWAPQVWKKFDAEAARRDFARMKELGVNCVRVFLTYGSFLMEPNVVSPEGLAKLDQFLAIAEDAGIYVHPTGPDHWEGMPRWAQSDRYADEVVLRGVEFFWRQLAARYRGRATIFAYDLLNEPEIRWDTPPMCEQWNRWLEKKYASAPKLAQAWGATNQDFAFGSIPVPPKDDCAGCARLLDFQRFREDVADDWARRQVAAIKAADPHALVTVGLIQWSVPSLLAAGWQYSAFRPERQVRLLDFMEIHFYPLANGFYEYAPEDEARNLAYLENVVSEVARCGKPVVIAEFGWYGGGKPTFGNHAFASEDQQARWCEQVVTSTAGLTCGWLNWGLYDHPGAGDVSQLIGLLTSDGKLKAWGGKFKELSASHGNRKLTPPKLGPRPTLDWDLCITSAAEGAKFRQRYLEAWRAGRK